MGIIGKLFHGDTQELQAQIKQQGSIIAMMGSRMKEMNRTIQGQNEVLALQNAAIQDMMGRFEYLTSWAEKKINTVATEAVRTMSEDPEVFMTCRDFMVSQGVVLRNGRSNTLLSFSQVVHRRFRGENIRRKFAPYSPECSNGVFSYPVGFLKEVWKEVGGRYV